MQSDNVQEPNNDSDDELDTQSDDSLDRTGTYIPKPRVQPTQQKIADKILEQNKFENQVLVHDGKHILTRGELYRSFGENGEIYMEVRIPDMFNIVTTREVV